MQKETMSRPPRASALTSASTTNAFSVPSDSARRERRGIDSAEACGAFIIYLGTARETFALPARANRVRRSIRRRTAGARSFRRDARASAPNELRSSTPAHKAAGVAQTTPRCEARRAHTTDADRARIPVRAAFVADPAAES